MRQLFACAAFASLLALAGCDPRAADVKAAEAAEKRYDMIMANGTLGEACDTATEVRDAWLKALNKEKYQLWSSTASIYCMSAAQDGRSASADLKKRQSAEEAVDNALDEATAAIERADSAVENASAAIIETEDVSESNAPDTYGE